MASAQLSFVGQFIWAAIEERQKATTALMTCMARRQVLTGRANEHRE